MCPLSAMPICACLSAQIRARARARARAGIAGVHKNCYDTTFENETFIVFVHGSNVDLAKAEEDDDHALAAGLALTLECWDYDMIGVLARAYLCVPAPANSPELRF